MAQKPEIELRKGQHIELCLEDDSQGHSEFHKYKLPYSALPESSLEKISISTKLFDHKLDQPLVIASMTGGSEHGRTINTNLAIGAEETGVALGVGSQRIGLEKSDAMGTFKLVRKNAPTAFLIANMGAVQLNYGHTIDSYRKVVDMIEANALYLHLNPLQEALQPGGDTNYTGLLDKIREVVEKVDVPVIVKEVGHGISRAVAEQLYSVGVAAIDVAGTGGTSYAWVEAKRAENANFQEWFKDFGIATTDSIANVKSATTSDKQLVIASGGVRSPLDGIKSSILGANLYSAAVPFLRPAMKSPEAVIETIQQWEEGLRIGLFASGAEQWSDAAQLEFQKQIVLDSKQID